MKGSTITLVADGADEQEAIDTLTALINSDFPSDPNNMKPKQGRVISTPLFS